MNRKYCWLAVVVFILTHLVFQYPLSYEEVKEGYSAYLNEPKFFYSTDNYYVSTFGVYAKTLSIFLFGLNTLAVRLPNLVAGIFVLWASWQLASKLPGSKKRNSYLVLIVALLLPFIRVSMDNFGLTLSLGFLLLSLKALLEENYKHLFFYLVALLFASPYMFIFILLISLWLSFKRFYFLLLPLLILPLIILTPLDGFIYQTSVLKFLHPSSYVFTLDNNLSYGAIHDSPLITDSFNLNRFFYNKPSFLIRRVFIWTASLFDFEYLTSFNKAGTILAKETVNTNPLPWLFFWEIPLLVYGIYLLIKQSPQKIKVFCLFLFGGFYFWGMEAFILVVPIFLLSYWQLVSQIKINKIFASFLLVFAFFSYLNFLYIYAREPWQTNLARSNWEIWQHLEREEISDNKVVVTDRLGESAYFYLFYEKVNKEDYYQNRKLGIITPDGRQRTEAIGNVHFRSFDFQNEDIDKNQVWIGFPGEFGDEVVPDEKIDNLSSGSAEIGEGLWIVKTNE